VTLFQTGRIHNTSPSQPRTGTGAESSSMLQSLAMAARVARASTRAEGPILARQRHCITVGCTESSRLCGIDRRQKRSTACFPLNCSLVKITRMINSILGKRGFQIARRFPNHEHDLNALPRNFVGIVEKGGCSDEVYAVGSLESNIRTIKLLQAFYAEAR